MAGLSVLLETQECFPKYTHIISKTSILKNTSLSSSSSSSSSSSAASSSYSPSATHGSTFFTFLDRCYLCRRKLQQGQDIYMYRGDRAFCSEECRCRQIFMDEESGKRDHCSLAAAASFKYSAGLCRGRAAARGRALAGDFAY